MPHRPITYLPTTSLVAYVAAMWFLVFPLFLMLRQWGDSDPWLPLLTFWLIIIILAGLGTGLFVFAATRHHHHLSCTVPDRIGVSLRQALLVVVVLVLLSVLMVALYLAE